MAQSITPFLNYFLPDLLRISATYRKAFTIVHLYNQPAIEVFLNFLQVMQVNDGGAVNTDKDLRIQDLFQLSNAGRTKVLIGIGR